jgi:hypothetical protein
VLCSVYRRRSSAMEAQATRRSGKGGTNVAGRIDHREHPGARVSSEGPNGFGSAVVEETGKSSFVRRGKALLVSVPCELERHLDVGIRREFCWASEPEDGVGGDSEEPEEEGACERVERVRQPSRGYVHHNAHPPTSFTHSDPYSSNHKTLSSESSITLAALSSAVAHSFSIFSSVTHSSILHP